jgi:hypothetical protein
MKFLLDLSLPRIFGSIMRLIGVCVLYLTGLVVKTIRPSARTYSFKDIYNMDFGKQDPWKMNNDEFNQQITGFLFVLAAVIVYSAIF